MADGEHGFESHWGHQIVFADVRGLHVRVPSPTGLKHEARFLYSLAAQDVERLRLLERYRLLECRRANLGVERPEGEGAEDGLYVADAQPRRPTKLSGKRPLPS